MGLALLVVNFDDITVVPASRKKNKEKKKARVRIPVSRQGVHSWLWGMMRNLFRFRFWPSGSPPKFLGEWLTILIAHFSPRRPIAGRMPVGTGRRTESGDSVSSLYTFEGLYFNAFFQSGQAFTADTVHVRGFDASGNLIGTSELAAAWTKPVLTHLGSGLASLRGHHPSLGYLSTPTSDVTPGLVLWTIDDLTVRVNGTRCRTRDHMLAPIVIAGPRHFSKSAVGNEVAPCTEQPRYNVGN